MSVQSSHSQAQAGIDLCSQTVITCQCPWNPRGAPWSPRFYRSPRGL